MVMIVPGDRNEVGIGGLTDARLRAGDYSGSGLEALGAGLAKLGESGGQFAQALGENHQRNRDDAAVKQAYVAFSDAVAPLLHGDDGMLNREGADAHAAFPDVASGLADAYDQALAPLSPQQRALVAPALADRLRNYVALSGQHVRQQGAVEQRRQSEALQQSAARDAVAHVGDPELHERYLSTGENALRQQAKIDNLPGKQADEQLANYRSGVHADSIDALTPQDPVRAAGYYGRVAGAMTDPDKQMIEKTLDPALAHARSIADVDAAGAADSATAPATPHADDPHTLLLKMEGITPEGDQPQLPALLQRYHGDAARAWAAFAAGPDTLDKLIAAKGDGWYGAIGDDVRRFVDHNIALLGASSSARTLPADPQAAAARIAAQDWDDGRKARALDELRYRSLRAGQARDAGARAATDQAFATADKLGQGFTALSQIDPATRRALPDNIVAALERRADAHVHPQPVDPEGPVAQQLRMLASGAPDAFRATDLRQYRDLVAPQEYAMFQRVQQGPPTDHAIQGAGSATATTSPGDSSGVAGIRDDALSSVKSVLQQPVNFLTDSEGAAIGDESLSADATGGVPADTAAGETLGQDGGGQGSSELAPYKKPPNSPVPLRIGMKVSPEMVGWLQKNAPTYRYSLNDAPDFITQFRARNPEFVRIERENFERSKIAPSWFSSRRERTLLVYQSITDPRQYKIKTVIGEANITKFFRPDGTKLPFGELPSKKGYKLIIAEHTHPRPVETWLLGSAAQRGPSNADIAYAWLNPSVHFIIKAVYSYDTSNSSADEEYYYGNGFHGQGFHP